MIRAHLLPPLLLAFLTGCATLGENECRTGDWYGIGRDDGRNGKRLSLIEDHRKACSEYGIVINDRAYRDGRAEGLRDYCRLDNAFRAGLNGESYQGVCPTPIDSEFRRAHAAAYEVHKVRKEIENLDGQITRNESKLRDKDTSDKERARLRDEIRDLDRRRARLRDELFQVERQLDRQRDDARRFERRGY
jgi:hypothetical protein